MGVTVRRGSQEGSVVLFAGGWADLIYWSGDPAFEPVSDAPGWEDWLDVARFGLLLDRFAEMFR